MGSFTMLRTTVSESLPTVHEETWIISVTCCLLSHPFPWDAACAMECLGWRFFGVMICFMIKKPLLWKYLKEQMSGGYYWLETGGKISREVLLTHFSFFFLFFCWERHFHFTATVTYSSSVHIFTKLERTAFKHFYLNTA